jgi:hypothetical protein
VATLTELTNEVLSHQFSPSQYTTYAQGKINQGLDYVAAQTDFRELLDTESYTTSNGTASYALPSDFSRLYNVEIFDADGVLMPLAAETLIGYDTKAPSQTGRPQLYVIEGSSLKLWPVPDGAYTIRVRHYRKPASLSGALDEPEIPATYHHLLVSYALWHCYERENDYNSAQYHKARFDEDLAKCRGEVQYDTDDYTQSKLVGDDRTDPLAPSVWVV